jgi:hypothetical protein
VFVLDHFRPRSDFCVMGVDVDVDGGWDLCVDLSKVVIRFVSSTDASGRRLSARIWGRRRRCRLQLRLDGADFIVVCR